MSSRPRSYLIAVNGCPEHEDDLSIPGLYVARVKGHQGLPLDHLQDMILSAWHDKYGVKNLDPFSFTVTNWNAIELPYYDGPDHLDIPDDVEIDIWENNETYVIPYILVGILGDMKKLSQDKNAHPGTWNALEPQMGEISKMLSKASGASDTDEAHCRLIQNTLAFIHFGAGHLDETEEAKNQFASCMNRLKTLGSFLAENGADPYTDAPDFKERTQAALAENVEGVFTLLDGTPMTDEQIAMVVEVTSSVLRDQIAAVNWPDLSVPNDELEA